MYVVRSFEQPFWEVSADHDRTSLENNVTGGIMDETDYRNWGQPPEC